MGVCMYKYIIILVLFFALLVSSCDNIPTSSTVGKISGTVSIYDLGFAYPVDGFQIDLRVGSNYGTEIANATTNINGEYSIYFDKIDNSRQARLAIMSHYLSGFVSTDPDQSSTYYYYFDNLSNIEEDACDALFIRIHELDISSSNNTVLELEPVTISWLPISPFPYKINVSGGGNSATYYTDNSNYTFIFPETTTNSSTDIEITINAYRCLDDLYSYSGEWKSETILITVNDNGI